MDDPTRYGVIQTDSNGKVINLIEKPSSAQFGNEVSTGVYIINKRVLSLLPGNVPFDFAKDLFPSLIETSKVGVFRHDGYWCDIGDKKSYYNANFYMSEESFYPFINFKESENSVIKKGSLIAKSALTVGKIRQSIIGENAKISSSANLDGCIVMGGVTVKGRYKDCIIGDGYCENVKSLDKIGQENTSVYNKISLIEH